MSDQAYWHGTGRRKTAVAQVKLFPGKGNIVVNDKLLDEYVPSMALRSRVFSPLQAVGAIGKYNAVVKVTGGGVTGQAEAIRHGIARALVREDEENKSVLRKEGLLTRDPRVKERKKYGLKGARKAPQYTKR
ncbi:MAG: 30S ribosomal protein S9 [Chloroflexota bacterium]|nr:30S ribosomal protein S9 [Chloroflexota bacterium]